MEVASPLPFHCASAGTKRQFSASPGVLAGSFDATATAGPSSSGPDGNFNYNSHHDNHFAAGVGTAAAALHNHSSFASGGAARSFKRRRFLGPAADESMGGDSDDAENSQNVTAARHHHHQQQPTNFFNGNYYGSSSVKRSRAAVASASSSSSSSSSGASPQQQHIHHHQQAEMQKVIDSQAAEIQSLKSNKTLLEGMLHSFKAEQDKMSEENRILKRGVAIQHNAQTNSASELQATKQQNVQLKEENRMLQQQVLSLRYQLQAHASAPMDDFMGGFSPRPPDVY